MGTRPAEARIMAFLQDSRYRFVHTGGIARGADVSRETVRRVLRDLSQQGRLQSGPARTDSTHWCPTGTLGYRLIEPGQETVMTDPPARLIDEETWRRLRDEHDAAYATGLADPPPPYQNLVGFQVRPDGRYPGLPHGWQLMAAQSGVNLAWYYRLTTPDHYTLTSPAHWWTAQDATEAGLAKAIELADDGLDAVAQARAAMASGKVPYPDGDLITAAMWHLATEGVTPRLERLALAGALVALEIDRMAIVAEFERHRHGEDVSS